MIKEAIEKIIEIAKPAIVTNEDNREYATGNLHPIKEPVTAPISIHTIKGLLGWLGSGDSTGLGVILHVEDPHTIDAMGPIMGRWRQRESFVICKMYQNDSFPFGRFLNIEEFIIQLQCKFAANDTKKKVIDYVSGIRGEHVTTSEDDGITQEVTVNDKIGRLSKVTIDPIVTLAPYRTFPEVRQPPSPFLLRLKKVDGNLPSVALFEADAGAWRLEAVKSIADTLANSVVVKERKIDVLA